MKMTRTSYTDCMVKLESRASISIGNYQHSFGRGLLQRTTSGWENLQTIRRKDVTESGELMLDQAKIGNRNSAAVVLSNIQVVNERKTGVSETYWRRRLKSPIIRCRAWPQAVKVLTVCLHDSNCLIWLDCSIEIVSRYNVFCIASG